MEVKDRLQLPQYLSLDAFETPQEDQGGANGAPYAAQKRHA
jgi:hypothetical protein